MTAFFSSAERERERNVSKRYFRYERHTLLIIKDSMIIYSNPDHLRSGPLLVRSADGTTAALPRRRRGHYSGVTKEAPEARERRAGALVRLRLANVQAVRVESKDPPSSGKQGIVTSSVLQTLGRSKRYQTTPPSHPWSYPCFVSRDLTGEGRGVCFIINNAGSCYLRNVHSLKSFCCPGTEISHALLV